MKEGFHLGEATYSKVQSDKGSAIFSEIYSEVHVIKSLHSIDVRKIE